MTQIYFCIQVHFILVALGFFPINYVNKAFEKLLDSEYYKEHDHFIQQIEDYFEDTWIGRLTQREGMKKFNIFHSYLEFV